ncbi:MAG: hypothetical protein LBN10_11035 [Propionibacteriaceae bacterium]|jgi:hypothetical protein|nr:hypothetical protein [Propionibacteriaceae bacterium]
MSGQEPDAPRRGIIEETNEEEPEREGRRWWVFLLVLLIVVVLVTGGVAAWWFLLRQPEPLAPPKNPGPDLAQNPSVSAGTNILGKVEDLDRYYYTNTAEDPVTAGIGLTYSQGDYNQLELDHPSAGWYEGFAEDYSDAFAAGQACAGVPEPPYWDYAAWGAWTPEADVTNNYKFPFCNRFANPSLGDAEKYSNDATSGYRAGWVDGVQGTPGVHEVNRREVLEQGSFLMGFALADGRALWTYTLEDLGVTWPSLKRLTYQSAVKPSDPAPNTHIAANGKGRIAFLVSGVDETQTPVTKLVILDATTGAVGGAIAWPDPTAQILAFVDSILVITGATGTTALSNLGTPLWTSPNRVSPDYEGQAAVVIGDDWVFTGDGYVALMDGRKASFGGDSSATVSYVESSDGSVFRYDETAHTLALIDVKTNTNVWGTPLLVSSPFVTVYDSIVYTSGTPIGAHILGSGKSAWSEKIGTPSLSGTILGIAGRSLIVEGSGNQVSALDLDTGEVTAVGSGPQVFLGPSMVYLSNPESQSLSARRIVESQVANAWTLTMQQGQHLALMSRVFLVWGDSGIVRVLS